MFPPWFLPTFYSLSGALVAYLVYRIWRKNQQVTPPAVTSMDARRAPVERVVEAAMAKVSVTPPPVVETVANMAPSILKAPAALAIPTATAAAVAPVAAAAAQVARAPQTRRWERDDQLEMPWKSGIAAASSAAALPTILPEDIPFAGTEDRVFGGLNPAFASLLPESDQRKAEIRKDLNHAGYYSPHAWENLAATRYVLMMAALLFFGVLLLFIPQRLEWLAICGLVIGPILGWAAPRLFVTSKAKTRLTQIERAMPDLLDMMNMCVSQGMTVPAALNRVQRDLRGVYPDLAQEIGIVLQQATIASLPVALQNFSKRIDLPEVHSFTSLLTQTEKMGTSVSDALTEYSDSMRESLKQRAEEKGNSATFRLLFPTVLCLMPAVYLFLLGPAVIELSKFFYGGGRDALDQGGSAVIQRINNTRQRLLQDGVNR